MTKVLHIPGNIEILHHALDEDINLAETGLRPPITPEAVLELPTWEEFDVLHVHTVEFTDQSALERLGKTALHLGKRLVFSLHELSPNIESDQLSFVDKTRCITAMAHAVVTLSNAALHEGSERFAIPDEKMLVIPHGQPFEASVVDSRGSDARAIAAYSSMRTYRHYTNLVRAWRTLDPNERPPLRVWVRSLAKFGEEFYKDDLAELRATADEESDFMLRVQSSFIPTNELVEWLRPVGTLVLPYSNITHSGQLELGLDLGMRVIAPDFSTLRSQAAPHPRARTHAVFVEPTDITDPTAYARHLNVPHAARSKPTVDMERSVREHRARELGLILEGYRRAYNVG